MTELVKFSIDDKIAIELKKLSKLWNIDEEALSKKLFLDGLQEFRKDSLDFALKKYKENKADPEDLAELLGMTLDEFEDLGVERGIIEDITMEQIEQCLRDSETLRKKMRGELA
ncbi:MAG TPA: hypothetical protein EYP22_01235 [Methanosarcinales archaeon]|nr:hypothetical protein [Methanosarcinales archaeon]